MATLLKIFVTVTWLVVVQAAPRQKRLTVAEHMPSYYYNNIDGNPDVYAFGYDVSDPATGNNQFRAEQRHPNGTVTGNYGYIDAAGRPRRFKYIADERGYRVFTDYATQSPIPRPSVQSGNMDSSITWTRPPKKTNKKKNTITNDIVSKLGLLFGY